MAAKEKNVVRITTYEFFAYRLEGKTSLGCDDFCQPERRGKKL
jgi:hypothetical protein